MAEVLRRDGTREVLAADSTMRAASFSKAAVPGPSVDGLFCGRDLLGLHRAADVATVGSSSDPLDLDHLSSRTSST